MRELLQVRYQGQECILAMHGSMSEAAEDNFEKNCSSSPTSRSAMHDCSMSEVAEVNPMLTPPTHSQATSL